MIYPQLLQSDFARLPSALRDFHSAAAGGRAAGKAAVRHTSGWLARLIGFPPAGDDIAVRLDVIADQDREIWTRCFDKAKLRSTQWLEAGLLVEAFGPLRLYFRVLAIEAGMRFESQRARLCGIPFPVRVEAVVRGSESSWWFEVTVAHVGWYRGVMEPLP